MSDSELYDLIIIGGGPGGLSAGIYAMRAALKTVLVERGAPGGQVNNSDSVENWPGDEHIGGAELAMKFSLHAQSYGLEVRSEEVVDLEPGLDFHTVRLGDGSSLRSHAVILAVTGFSSAIKLWWSSAAVTRLRRNPSIWQNWQSRFILSTEGMPCERVHCCNNG
jgi:thioredoxin reductase (NADPH)